MLFWCRLFTVCVCVWFPTGSGAMIALIVIGIIIILTILLIILKTYNR